MYPTAEVRWFYAGRVPPEVRAWFRQAVRQPMGPLHRVDYYLRLADGDSLGIKLREGRVEIKKRLGQRGVVHFHRRVAGVVERWRKWSFVLAEAGQEVASLIHPASSWIGVQKERALCRYRLEGSQQGVVVPAGEPASLGCGLELTTLRLWGEEWWTVGFEAFGGEASLEEALLLAADLALGEEPPVLEARDSYGYPRWLEIVEAGVVLC